MKLIILSVSVLTLAFFPSCTDSEASLVTASERPPENGAKFEKGKGLSLTEEMAHAIGLKIADVEEQKLVPRLPFTIRTIAGSNVATGWLTATQAEKLKSNAVVAFAGDISQKGTIRSIEKPTLEGLGDYAVTVMSDGSWPESSEIQAVVQLEETEPVTSIPRSALLSTAEGHFVYAVNGKNFFRTAVKVGAMNETLVEISDGLFAGDAVVTTPVHSLWMAELQVLRGGKACTCGH